MGSDAALLVSNALRLSFNRTTAHGCAGGNCDCGHRSGKALTDFDDQLAAIKCAHCGNKNLYRWSARSEQNYTPKSVET
jgi:hypothetical protein